VIPNPPAFCTLSGFVEDVTGQPLRNAFVRMRILDGVDAVVGAVAFSSSPLSLYTGTDGSFMFTLPQGALARIEIPETALDAVLTVPNLTTVTLASITLTEYNP
jgi:hypothetical protein